MKIKLYQIDAFSNKVFSGNPAAVCPLEKWLPDTTLQNIATENNLAETAYYVKTQSGYHIRWFTPTAEIDLCGHATLASAYVIFNFFNYPSPNIGFESRSGMLSVTRKEDWYTLNFPADQVREIAVTPELTSCLGIQPTQAFLGIADAMLVFTNRQEVEQAKPNLARIAGLKARGVIITAPGTDTDFVSRFFAPQFGIDEDPVTGSAHTTLTPYWSKRLGKTALTARQVSKRGGFLKLKNLGDRVEISGQGAFYMEGEIDVTE